MSWTDDAHYFEETINISKVKKLLDNAVGDKGVPNALEGMKWLLAQISKGRDVSDLFASVVKNVSTKSVELKKMVYMFLVHYVDANKTCRELALLAINSYQKDLADRNQLVRALSLRVLTSFRVPEICQIQLLALRRCAKDRSPFVRKTAVRRFSTHPSHPKKKKKMNLFDQLPYHHSFIVILNKHIYHRHTPYQNCMPQERV